MQSGNVLQPCPGNAASPCGMSPGTLCQPLTADGHVASIDESRAEQFQCPIYNKLNCTSGAIYTLYDIMMEGYEQV